MYPPITPHAEGTLATGDGHELAWEVSGHPDGAAALVLHGGPGSGRSSGSRRLFDPGAYRIVAFDQRGCGQSQPHASEPHADLSTNTTHHLVADIERLRRHLGVERWLVFGHSWGSVLGLTYAQRHRERVRALVLAGVTTGRRWEIEWLYRTVAPMFPDAWSAFRDGVPEAERDGDLVAAYWRRLHDPDPQVRNEAARRWTDWDWSTASSEPGAPRPSRWDDPAFQLARARICTHYFTHDCWLADGELLAGAGALTGVPGVLVNGRLDLQCPLASAVALHRAWPGSELVVVAGAGHSLADGGMAAAIVAATDRLRP